MKKILIIDDDMVLTTLLSGLLEKSGYAVSKASNGSDGLRAVRVKSPDLVITDYEMPGISGLDVLRDIVNSYPGIPVIMLTCHNDVSLTIRAIQAGAYDYLEKPIQPKRMLEAVRSGLEVSVQNQQIMQKIAPPVRKIIEENLLAGNSRGIREIVKQIGKIAMNRMNVLLTGEPGTGKLQIANLIHYSGITGDDPIVVINCDTLHGDRSEQQLFGYTKRMNKFAKNFIPGSLYEAQEGSLVLNEFQHLPLMTQIKLARVIEGRSYHVPGEDEARPFHARVIATCSESPEALIADGKILMDLFYQIKVFYINIPPLRERIVDMPELVTYLMDKQRRRLSRNIVRIEDGVIELLTRYHWPGNIRELENAIVQGMILARGDMLEKEHIHTYLQSQITEAVGQNTSSLEEVEKMHITRVLELVNWQKQLAAKILNISRPTLNSKIEKFGLVAPLSSRDF
jgi:DNA-binding NtrC family response regulator